ncbi:MAG: hypothetical protein E7600_05770 [Ruminococcaceae bacterium]|nr:hypothetical protein [Oscillospiraceae bacterium]
MKAIGVVTEVKGKTVLVKGTRSSACSSCHNCEAKESCHIELIFGDQKQDVFVEAYNSVGACVGNRVALESATDKTLFASVFTFIIPIILAVVTYLVASSYFTQELSAILTLIALVITFLASSKLMNVFAKKHLKPVVTEILEESELD